VASVGEKRDVETTIAMRKMKEAVWEAGRVLSDPLEESCVVKVQSGVLMKIAINEGKGVGLLGVNAHCCTDNLGRGGSKFGKESC
jgi:hypothetical protein